MIRFLLRMIGLFGLAAAFILVIYDGTKSIASNTVLLTSVRTLWDTLNAASLQNLRPLLEQKATPYLWDPVFTTFLSWPSWAVLACLGVALILLGRKKRPLIGYSR
ncbi:MAG: hypothetical protein AB7O50_02105 [Pseudolabrys sp.]